MNCYFCGGELVGKTNFHHICPRRYFHSKKDADLNGNVVEVHVSCHVTHHRIHDNSKWRLKHFNKEARENNYWENSLEPPT